MENHRQGDRLSWGDTVFLHLEREGMPLNVASVCEFEGEVSFDEFLRSVESRLPLLPRYLKRVVSPPFNIGLPSWEYDPGFDVRNHVREITLKTGKDVELKALAGRLFSKVMDRQRPLWDLTLVHGLKGNRTGLIARLHHCLADGIAGVGIMKVLLDESPARPILPRKRMEMHVPPARDPLTSLMNGVVDSYSDLVKRTLSAAADVLTMAERATANGETLPTDEVSRFLPEITAFTDRLRFNVPYRGPQKFAWAEIPLAEVKAIRHACGTSVNDVVLALMTATIRRYSELHGDRVKGRLLRMMVPVNLRGSENPSELGNRISLVPVTIPLDIRDPRKLLAAAHARTEFIKRAHAAGRANAEPLADHAVQSGLHQRARATISALSTRAQDAELVSVCSGRRRDGRQLRDFELQRHDVLRLQWRRARCTGSASVGNAPQIEFHRVAGSYPRRTHETKKG